MKETRVVKVHKAMGIREDDVQPLRIEVTDVQYYGGETPLDFLKTQWRDEGKMLSDALFDHLPGGLIDGLLTAMLERRASLFVVRF